MRINSIEITNFRGFKAFSLVLEGTSAILVSENAAGKTSLLAAVAKALGKDRGVLREDFTDLALPIEIKVTLLGFERSDQIRFPRELSFGGPTPSLCIGFKATWDAAEEDIESVCGFPDHGWKPASRAQREALPLLWLPSFRDPPKLLQFAMNRGFFGRLLAARKLDVAVDAAAQSVTAALEAFIADRSVESLLAQLRTGLARLLPGVDARAFSLGMHASGSHVELLREFEVLLSHYGPHLPLGRQSNGLAQVAVFVAAFELVSSDPKTVLLVDEPEISLHPQAQRAVSSALRALPNQSLLATHSSSVLDRADLRSVVRLSMVADSVRASRATNLSDAEATRLTRFVNPLTAEACFARKVIFVEGYSDRVLLLRLASRQNRDLDAEGVTIVSLDGGGAIGTFLALFGSLGLGLPVFGLCDEDKEAQWISEVQKTDSTISDRSSMERAGFFVCVRDLEHELVRALGVPGAENVIANERMQAKLESFRKQPQQRARSADEQLRAFFHQDNIRWAVPLADAIDLQAIPRPLNELLAKF